MCENAKFRLCYLIFAGFFIALMACKAYDLGSEPDSYIEVDVNNPTWDSGGVGLVFLYKCATCHTADREWYVPSNTPTTYDEIHNEDFFTSEANAGKLNNIKTRMFSTPDNPMPPHYATALSDDEKTAVQKYLDTLMQPKPGDTGKTPAGCENLPTSTSLTYADIKGTVDSSCATCHSAGGQAPPMVTEDNVKAQKLNMARRIKDTNSPMPPGNADFGKSEPAKKLLEFLCLVK